MGLTVVVTLLVLLAGCAGSGAPKDAPAEPRVPVGEASYEGNETQSEAAAAVGGIEGTVVDEEQIPLAGVKIAVAELKLEVLSDSNGSFAFLDVPVGRHELYTQLIGYESAARSVEVMEGETSDVSFVLVRLAAIVAYHATTTYAGKMTCGAALVPWCGVFDEANQVYGTPNPTNERWLFNWTYPGGEAPAQMVSELVWQPATGYTAKAFIVALLIDDAIAQDEEGPSPVRMVTEGSVIAGKLKSNPNYKFQIGIYPTLMDLVVDQRFTLHRTDFYGEPAPEGWSFLTEAAP